MKKLMIVLAVMAVFGLATAAQAAFTPGDLSPNVWFDVTSTNLVKDGSNNVTGWTDETANPITLSKAGGGTVKYDADAFGTGIAGVDFNPSGQWDTTSLTSSTGIADAKFSTAAHMFIVLTAGDPGPALWYGAWSTSNCDYAVLTGYSSATQVLAGGGFKNMGNPGSGTVILELQFDTTNGYKLYYDGADERTNTNTSAWSSSTDAFYVGASVSGYPFYGKVGDVVMFNSVLSSEDGQKMGQYLETKYGLTTDYDYDFGPEIPEPAGLGLLGVALLGLRRRRA